MGNDARDSYLEEIAVELTYNSTKTENPNITLHDTSAVLNDETLANFCGTLRDLYEIDNFGRAWNEVRKCVASSRAGVSLDDVLHYHRIMTARTYSRSMWSAGERPGSFKVRDYGVGPNAEIGYVPDEIPDAMCDLVSEVNEILTVNNGRDMSDESAGDEIRIANPSQALIVGSYFHAKLVEIHPFADGNGRCARLLQNLILLQLGHPPIVQREEDRMSYYGVLDEFHYEGSLGSLIEFNVVETYKTWSRVLIG